MPTQLIVALDVDTPQEMQTALAELAGLPLWIKIGKQLFTANGPEVVRLAKSHGHKVFLDLKFHDIPNTAAQAVRCALELGADMVNFHAAGGSAMIREAVQLNAARHPEALLIAVTVLTSMDQAALAELGIPGSPLDIALRYAAVARQGGAHGVVCSAHEVAAIKQACGPSFLTVVPGIRPAGAEAQDQKRIMTPAAAAAAGADFIVVGRPVMQAKDRRAAALAVLAQLEGRP